MFRSGEQSSLGVFVIAIIIITMLVMVGKVMHVAYTRPPVNIIVAQIQQEATTGETSPLKIKEAVYHPVKWQPEKEAKVWYDIINDIYEESAGDRLKFSRALCAYMEISRREYYARFDKDINKVQRIAWEARTAQIRAVGMLKDMGMDIKTKAQYTTR